MNIINRFIAPILSLVLILTLVGCGSAAQGASSGSSSKAASSTAESGSSPTNGDTSYVIGVVLDNGSNPYQIAHGAALTKLGEELGHEVIVLDGKVDPQVKMNQVETLITRGADAITVQASDKANADSLIKECHSMGIPLIPFYNASDNETAPTVLLYEYETSFKMGSIAAEKWMGWYPDIPIRVGLIVDPTQAVAYAGRAMAFWDGVKSVSPDAVLASEMNGKRTRDISFKAAQDMLQAHPEVNIVYGENSESALGGLAAFEEAGRGKAVDGVPTTELFVGSNGSEVEAEKLYDPNSAFKITQALQPKANAKVVMDTILQILNGEIDMADDVVVSALNVVFTYWDYPIDEYEQFLVEQYAAEPGVADRLRETFEG